MSQSPFFPGPSLSMSSSPSPVPGLTLDAAGVGPSTPFLYTGREPSKDVSRFFVRHSSSRPRELPEIEVVPRHPLAHPHFTAWVIRVVPDVLKKTASSMTRLDTPSSSLTLEDNGYIRVPPRTMVFARNVRRSDLPFDDMLIMLVDDEVSVHERQSLVVHQLIALRDRFFGPRGVRQPCRKGGVSFEEGDRRVRTTNKGPRCYAIAQSNEVQRGLCHPCANVACGESANDEALLIRKECSRVRSV